MRLIGFLLVLGLAAGCNSVAPDDGAIVEKPVASETTETAATQTANETLSDATADATAGTETETGTETADSTQTATVEITNDNPEISDEQDFSAVTARVSIEDDKARLKAQRENYEVIAPTDLPTRKGKGPNVVAYALSTTHDVGEKKFKRLGILGASQSAKACKKYVSPDDAQLAFLAAGGPKRDVRNLDPDGDGFACDWSPGIYRAAVQ
ncbi:MAG: hypothetical protein ACE5DK_00845 [Paracoccaceae bacterium]